MKFLPVVLANFRRHRLRTILTILSVLVAFLLFGYLSAITKAFSMGIDIAGEDRLVVRHKVSIIQLLPESYEQDIESIDGVANATAFTWFGGIYQDPKNFFAQIATDPDEVWDIYPEYVIDEESLARFNATRTGAVVGKQTAERYGFKVGDRVPIQATIWQPRDGTQTWTFEIVGIYEAAEKGADDSQFFFRQDYLEENSYTGGQVGWYVIKVDDPDRSVELARTVDETFANSPAETKTETEGAFIQAFADQVGNIGAIVTAILSAVFFTILLVAGNTMAQAVRERTRELGVLKALGFSDAAVLALVLIESTIIAIIGGAIGLGLAWVLIAQGDPTGGALPLFYFPIRDLVLGAAFVLLLGIVAGLLPAIQAMRLNTVEALRRD
ncbi:MAG: FtsX-like permease family protein [Acidobacteria bacterium]|nr:FtsX-like permease family protein [Acidobacteriota bacterium]